MTGQTAGAKDKHVLSRQNPDSTDLARLRALLVRRTQEWTSPLQPEVVVGVPGPVGGNFNTSRHVDLNPNSSP